MDFMSNYQQGQMMPLSGLAPGNSAWGQMQGQRRRKMPGMDVGIQPIAPLEQKIDPFGEHAYTGPAMEGAAGWIPPAKEIDPTANAYQLNLVGKNPVVADPNAPAYYADQKAQEFMKGGPVPQPLSEEEQRRKLMEQAQLGKMYPQKF